MGPMNWDDLDRFHQKIDRQGKMIRWLAIAVMLVSAGLICGNVGNIIWAFGRIF